jgi:hypothetical protein
MDPERQQQQAAGGSGGGGSAAAAPAPRRPMIGDGGASWRLKALKRAQEQAKERGEDVGAVRGAGVGVVRCCDDAATVRAAVWSQAPTRGVPAQSKRARAFAPFLFRSSPSAMAPWLSLPRA